MKTNYKIFIIIALLLITYVGVGYFYVYQSKQTLSIQKYIEVSDRMKLHLETLIDEKREAILLVSLALSKNSEIRNSLVSNDIALLQFSDLSKTLHRDSSLKNVWFQLLDKKGTSVYRSWTDKHGDSLVSSRLDVAQMIAAPKIISSISTGKFDMTFKSMVPIYHKEKFMGVIETIARFNSIILKMKKKQYETLVLVDKSYKKQLVKADKQRFIHDGYYMAGLLEEKLYEFFSSTYKEQLLSIEHYLIDEKHKLLLTTYHLKDINGNEMGYFIMSKKLNMIDFSDIEQTVKSIIFTLFFIAFLIVGFSYYIYIIKYRKFIENQNEKLEKDVAFKTKELYYTAHHDGLTNLPNRVLFTDRLNESLKFASRNSIEVFVLFLDLDRFKEVNDTYGHDVGDTLLCEVTQRLKGALREVDTIARLGGDEFTIIVQDVSYNDMILIAKKLIISMRDVFYVDAIKIHSSFSIGISNYPNDGLNVEELLKNADIAMYRAKAEGKNRYKFYNQEMSQLAQKRVVLENDIKSALENGEFEAYFQPKVNARTEKIIGLEALIRWNHPTKGLVFPDSFIGFAEEIGLIVEIDSYMRRETMRITKEWSNRGLNFGKVSFNASTLELEDANFVEHIKSVIDELDYDTSKLELEILESQSMQNRDRMIAILKEIKSLGVSISIDDFGTGYSSLSYLKQLPIDKLKIDRSFIVDTPSDSASVALVRTIITLATNLNLELVAEGVENKEQVEFLLKEGCEDIQGFYYSKAIPADAMEKLLVEGFKNLG